MGNGKEKEITRDSKYIQQHLANERTVLAWIRTAIAVTGIGFLVTNMHVKGSISWMGDITVLMIGILSVFTGILTITLATVSYFQKLRQINEQTFLSSRKLVLFLAVLMVLIIAVFGVYFLTL
ncbi:MAG: YidH family protein [Ectobacillus sp.]